MSDVKKAKAPEEALSMRETQQIALEILHTVAEICEKLRLADTVVIASPVYFYGLSAQLKALIDRLHTPMRNSFSIRRLGLILVGAASLPDLFDPIILQYRMTLRFFGLEDIGMVLVRGAKEKGDVLAGDGIQRAYELGKGAP